MAFFYSDNKEPFSGNVVPYHKQNATKAYLRHYDNYLYLQFIVQNSDRETERNQASKELTICERKLKHWRQHANYDQAVALAGIADLKKRWKMDKK